MVEFNAFLDTLRGICAGLPGAEEYIMHHHPSFRVGKKPFAICGEGNENHPATLSINHGLFDQPLMLEDPRFSRTHYIGQHGWVTIAIADLNGLDELRHLVVTSYKRIAPKKALKALEAASV